MEQKLYGLSNDYLFKKVFINEQICRRFLKDIFEIEINNFYYSNKEMVKENKDLSYGISDLILKTNNETIIIEMQNSNNHDIENRSMVYLSKLYSEQWNSKDYKLLKPITICLILNYNYKEKELQEYKMLETELYEKFGTNFTVKIWNLKIDSEDNKKKEYVELFNIKKDLETLRKETKLQEILNLIEEYNMDKDVYQKMKERELMEWTIEDEFKLREMTAHQRGEEKGRMAGKKEGIKEGLKEGIRRTVKNMLSEGFSIETIMKATKLSKQEIEEYKEG